MRVFLVQNRILFQAGKWPLWSLTTPRSNPRDLWPLSVTWVTLEVFYGSATACSDLIQDSSIQLVPLHKERICIEHTNRVQDQIFFTKITAGWKRENTGKCGNFPIPGGNRGTTKKTFSVGKTHRPTSLNGKISQGFPVFFRASLSGISFHIFLGPGNWWQFWQLRTIKLDMSSFVSYSW